LVGVSSENFSESFFSLLLLVVQLALPPAAADALKLPRKLIEAESSILLPLLIKLLLPPGE